MKKSSVRVVAALLLVCAALSACGRAKEPRELDEDDGAVRSFAEKTLYPLPAGFTVEGVAKLGDTVLIAGNRGDECTAVLASLTTDANELPQLSSTRELNIAAEHVYAVCAGEDGAFYIVTGRAPSEEAANGEYSIIRLSVSGETEEQFDFSFTPQGDDDIFAIAVDKRGMTVAASPSEYLVLDRKKMEQSSFYEEDRRIFGLQSCTLGITAGIYDPELRDNRTVTLGKDGAIRTAAGVPVSLSSCESIDGAYLVNDGSSFYTCDESGAQTAEPLRWSFSVQSVGGQVCQLDKHSYAYLRGDDTLTVVGSVVRDVSEKTVVTVGICGWQAYPMLVINEMNARDTEFFYKYKIYSEAEILKLQGELISGDVPDLLLFDPYRLDTSTGFYEDLYPYIDADPELTRDSFLPQYLTAMELNGELHELWSSCYICTLAVRTSDLRGRTGLRLEDYSAISDENERYRGVFPSFMTKETLLSWVGCMSSGEYLDRTTGECHFDDPSFAELLSWAKDNAPDRSGEETGIAWGPDEALLLVETLPALYNVSYLETDVFYEPYEFVGFPTDKGCGHFFRGMDGRCMAIPKSAAHKDGAWALIREQLTTQAQVSGYKLGSGLPVNFEAFKRCAYRELDEAAYERAVKLAAETSKIMSIADKTLADIVQSSGMAYMNGEKTLDETIRVIQSRAAIYVAEKFG